MSAITDPQRDPPVGAAIRVLLERGKRQLERVESEGALESLHEALNRAMKSEDEAAQALALRSLAKVHQQRGDQVAAKDCYDRLRVIADRLQDPAQRAWADLGLGTVAAACLERSSAKDYYSSALGTARECGDRSLLTSVLGHMGMLESETGDPAAAKSLLLESFTVAADNDKASRSSALVALGRNHERLREYADAIRCYRQVLDIVRDWGGPRKKWLALLLLGGAQYEHGDTVDAIANLEESSRIGEQLDDLEAELTPLVLMGLVHVRKGDHIRAVEVAQRSVTIAKRSGNLPKEADSRLQLAVQLGVTGDLLAQIRQAVRSLELAKAVQDDARALKAHWILGEAHRQLGDHQAALNHEAQRRALATSLGDHSDAMDAQLAMAASCFAEDDYSTSIRHSCQVREQAARMGDTARMLDALRWLTANYRQQGKYEMAAQIAHDRLEAARGSGDPYAQWAALLGLASIEKFLGDERSVEHVKQAASLARTFRVRGQELLTTQYLGSVLAALGRFDEAICVHKDALGIASDLHDPQGRANVLAGLGSTCFEAGRIEEAETHLYAALDILDSLRENLEDEEAYKIAFFETQQDAYLELQRVLIGRGKCDEALEVSERGRARVYAERVRRTLFDASGPSLNTAPSTVADIRRAVEKSRITIVEYAVDELLAKLSIWVIRPGSGIEFRQVELAPELLGVSKLFSVRGSRGSVKHGCSDGVAVQAQRALHRVLIEPIQDLLPDDPSMRVAFVPQGELFLVPFAALRDSSGTCLVERHTLSVSASIQLLLLAERAAQEQGSSDPRRGRALVVGNPSFNRLLWRELGPLSEAEVEVAAVAALFEADVYLRGDATREAVCTALPGARFVHIAAHAVPDDYSGVGFPGAIVLSPSEGDEGVLTCGDIVRLELGAELVVLSACSTGDGRITGDGVVGLSRAFLSAGARSVLVSLWAIGDEPTRYLMQDFYRIYLATGCKAGALREAMLLTRQRFPNPFDWAGFVLYGAGE